MLGHPQEEPSLDNLYVRQKMSILLLAGVLGALLAATILFDFDPDLSKVFEERSEQVAPGQEVPGGPSTEGPAATESRPEPVPIPQPELNEQSQATVVEGFSIVAYTPEPLPDDKRWLPSLVADLGADLCDRNRALEAANPRLAETMLARCSAPLDYYELSIVEQGSSAEQLVVVEFAPDGSGWTVRGFRYGMTEGDALPLLDRQWPEYAALEMLKQDMVEIVQKLTGYRISTSGVFANIDEVGRAYGEYLAAQESGEAAKATDLYLRLREMAPHFDFAVYRRAVSIYHPEMRAAYVDFLRDYYQSGGRHPRVVKLHVSQLFTESSTTRRKAREIVLQQLRENSLNMQADDTLRQIDYETPGSPLAESTTDGGLRDAISRHPTDGRYHQVLAQRLRVSPDTAGDAVEIARQGLKLNPWSANAHFQLGSALTMQANKHRMEGDWTPEQLNAGYQEGYEELATAWEHKPNQVEFFVDAIVEAQTQGRRKLPEERGGRYFIFKLNTISTGLTGSHYSKRVLKLFKDEEVQRWISALKVEIAAGNGRDEILLLCDIVVKRAAWEQGGDAPEAWTELVVAIKRYRAIGGRCRQVERLWKQLNG